MLNRLAGERLVHASAGNGFHVPVPDESRLRDLLNWNAHLLIHAARSLRRNDQPTGFAPAPDVAVRTAAIFIHIAQGPDNGEFLHAVTSVNDRLYAMRLLDERIIGSPDQELDDLEAAIIAGQSAIIVKKIRHYHRRRRNRLSAYVRLLRAQGVVPDMG